MKRLLFLFLVAAEAVEGRALPQPAQGEIRGEVQDPSGGVLVGARVVATEIATNQEFSAESNAQGLYVLSYLPPGRYNLWFESPGFQTLSREGVRVTTGERLRVDAALELLGVVETTTVVSDASLLRSESSGLGQVISRRSVVGLPLNGRNFVPLVALVPGVALPPGSSFPRINGGRPRVNEYLFDGVSVLQPEPGTVAFFPIIDAIEEFKVETNSPPAEFGRFSGGVINLTTRAGTNDLGGSLFGFVRNEALNARNYFAPKTEANPDKPLFRRHQGGFVLGGPLAKDRTFFFVDYQGTRQSIERVRLSTVPTLLQRQGIFTEPVAGRVPTIYDPATTTPVSGGIATRTPFPGNAIPPSRFDPAAVDLLNRYPLPNLPGTANNYRRVAPEDQDQDQFDFRIDHSFSDSDRIFGRFSYARDLSVPVTPLPDGSGAITAGAIGDTETRIQSLAFSHTHVFEKGHVNQLRVGYTRRGVFRTGLLLDGPASSELGIPGIPSNAAFGNALPAFLVDGFQQLGSPLNTNSDFTTDVTQIVDTFSIQMGRHSIKAGLDFRWERLDVIQPPSPTGTFRFTTQTTDLPGTPGTGSSLASFLLGQVQSYAVDLQESVLQPRAHIQEYFIQDDFRAASKLMVNAGIRFTFNFPSTEASNQGAVFNLETEELEYLGRDGFPETARELHKLNLGPRFGLAFQASEKSVVRAGYALIWIEQAGITTPFTIPQFPFLQSVTERSLDSIRPAFVLSQGPAVEPVGPTPEAGLGQGVFTVDRDLGSGYQQQWNLAFQRELSSDMALEVAYAGSKGTHIGIPDTNINQLTVDQLAQGASLLQRVPNPFFGEVPASSSLGGPTITRAQLLAPFPRFTGVSFYRNNVGDTKYHALETKLEKRFSRGLSFLVSYTWSRLMDDASSVFDATLLAGPVANYPVADSHNRELEWDVSNGDIPHAFVASFAYELPFEGNGFLGALMRDWTITGVGTLQSGIPLAVTQQTNFNAFAGFGTQRPNRVGDPELPSSERSTAQWFETSAFAVAPQFTLGSSSRNPVRGPGYRNLDLAFLRRVDLRGSWNLEVRVEIFNVTNTPPFGAPNTVFGSPAFGTITSAGDPRVVQLGLKLHF
jgi:hypothetical protein